MSRVVLGGSLATSCIERGKVARVGTASESFIKGTPAPLIPAVPAFNTGVERGCRNQHLLNKAKNGGK